MDCVGVVFVFGVAIRGKNGSEAMVMQMWRALDHKLFVEAIW
jgi:hypothetical protein